ncbi:MAG TPA: dihydrofolate reductase, partial [Candidatus Latescibacteria bacterium]|nr:dihydrofolate reductase [Candidatus Latescibacterota bacterium]
MIIISAMSKDRVIGSGEGMPWSVAEEYQQFLRFVEGQTVIMGRRSYDIFGPDLTSAHNIVISRSGVDQEGVEICGSVEEAVQRAGWYGKTVFCAGGGSIYAQMLPLVEDMYLSYIKGDFTGDAYFPEFDEGDWDVVERRDHEGFEFVHYR